MPRLTKGETASGIKSKSEAVARTIERRVEIFISLTAMVEPPIESLAVYRSANALASWSSPLDGILPVSIKTLRKHVETLYSGGLAQLCEAARNKSSSRIEKTPAQTSEHKVRTERAIDSALDMTVRYLDLLERFKKLSYLTESAEIELTKHLRRFGKNPHVKEIV